MPPTPANHLPTTHTHNWLQPQAKEARLAYLERLFAAISGALGQPVPARPSKVVAGLEPERTNEALQLLAAAAARGSTGHAAQAAQGAAPGGPARYAAPTSPARQPPPLPSADEAGPPVVFAPLENLLPALAWQVAEARAALSGADAPTSSQEALACCERVQAVGQHAATLTRCLEALQTSAATVAAECTAWRTEADQAAARLEAEARAEAEAGGASAQQLARLDAEIGRVRQRLAAAGGRQ